MYKKSIIIQLALFLFPFIFTAQTYHFTNYGVKDGLAQSNVSGIIQDSTGFFWFATEGGVSRFDGKNFVNYSTEDGLADNNVSAIFLDRRNHIWLGHENGSLTVCDGKKFTQIKSKLLPKDKKIYGFYQDRSGSLWISTFTAGVIKIMDPDHVGEQLHIKVYSGQEGLSQYVFSCFNDKTGNFWFLTDIGIKYMDARSQKFDFFRPADMPLGQITCLAKDREGDLLIGTSGGTVARYDLDKKQFEALIKPEDLAGLTLSGPNLIFTIYEDRKGNIWASGSNNGVFRYEKATKKVTLFNTSNGLAVNKIKSIYEDNEGNIILGTSGEGFEVFSGERFVSFSKKNGLLDNQVWAICRDNSGSYWFGTNEGITVYNPALPAGKAYKKITVEEGLPSNNIKAIVKDHAGNLWIAAWGGKVVKYDAQLSKIVSLPALNDIVNPLAGCLLLDSKNRLWIGTLEGVVIYDPVSGVIKTMRTIDGLSDNDISCLFEDSKGQIWIGTRQKGVTMYNGTSFKKFNRENGLNYNSISSVAEDDKHNIWIGTEGGGAFVYNGSTFRSYRVRNGLISDFITLISVDKKNNVWLGTNKGLNKFNAEKNSFIAYEKSDGFTGVETKPRAVYHDNEGNTWFGTINGAFKYNPDLDVPVTTEPLTKLLEFKVNLKDYPALANTKLSYKDNSLAFNYIGISLSNPEGVKYKLRLEGYDDDWQPATRQTFVTYSNLPPGHYVFQLVACNSAGVCDSKPISLNITITPPYWKTWWFYLIVFTAVVSCLFVYIKLRERQLRLEKSILEHKVNERTAEVVEKNKELDEINKDITASIRYAKRIQDAILPPDDFVRKHLPNTFILFKPKDIVSGDFYWMVEKGDHVIFAAVDCTGHGVPGAFMSIVGHNVLDRVVGEQNITQPAKILDELNKGIADTLRQNDLEDNTVRDGMDIALCSFNRTTGVLQYAGAYNPLWLIRNGELIEIKADKFPIGNSKSGVSNSFTNHELHLQKGDTLYIFSDGYSDQFGGPDGKKFKSSSLKALLLRSQHLSMDEQKYLLDITNVKWREGHEQVDDILVIGTRYV